MGEKTAIQWTEATWNPWHGCRKVSAGCKNCYMYRDKERFGQDPMRVVRSKSTFNEPLKWPEPKLIFTCSWSDWFIEEADAWRPEAWDIIRRTPHHTYQILTKRPERIADHLPDDWGEGYPNVWLGVSIEDQPAADKRALILLEIPAVLHFFSLEPLLGWVDLTSVSKTVDRTPYSEVWTKFDVLSGRRYTAGYKGGWVSAGPEGVCPRVGWVVVGGESGPKARPFNLGWARDIVKRCRDAGVPVFVKQLGSRPVGEWVDPHRQPMLAGHWRLVDRKGGDWNEWPEDLRVREMPVVSR